MANDRDHDDFGSLPPDVAAVLAAAGAPATEAELAGAEAAGIKLAAVSRSDGSVRGEKGLTGMFAGMWSGIRRRVPNVVLGVIIGSMVGGGAFAVAQTVGGQHGGPKPRYHDKKVCNLVDTSKLPGNWTHGDYVSAVEKQDPSKVREAAQSDCGKPIKGAKGNRGKGPKPEKTKEPKGSESAKPSAPATKKPSASPTPKPSATETATPSPEPSVTPSPTASASVTTPST